MSAAPAAERPPIPMGWCMTGDHGACRVAYTDWNGKPRVCPCPCHPKETP